MKLPRQAFFDLPDWVDDFLKERAKRDYSSPTARMKLAIELAATNIRRKTGSPCAAAIFTEESGHYRLIGVGVNRVIPMCCCIAHAEMMAIMTTQQKLGKVDFGGRGMPHAEMATSSEPCMMCMGAIVRSGIRSLLIGARDEDMRDIGSDEGIKPSDWRQQMEDRGMTVQDDVCRPDAVKVLQEYFKSGGLIYSGRGVNNQALAKEVSGLFVAT
jgi:tRNA(Arg) A34 adenosine deaminase TadA